MLISHMRMFHFGSSIFLYLGFSINVSAVAPNPPLQNEIDSSLPKRLKQVISMVQRNKGKDPVSSALVEQIGSGQSPFYFEEGRHIVVGDFVQEGSSAMVNIYSIDAHVFVYYKPTPGDSILPKVLHGMVEGARSYLTSHPEIRYFRLQVSNIKNKKLRNALINVFGFETSEPTHRFTFDPSGTRVFLELHRAHTSCPLEVSAFAN